MIMTNSLNLFLSLFCLFYITLLLALSFFRINIGQTFFRGVLEFLTIPVIVMTLVLWVYNFFRCRKEQWAGKNISFYLFLGLTAGVLAMIFATIYDN
jgi:hypothetical protein